MSGKHRHPDESPEEAALADEAYRRNESQDSAPPWSATKRTKEQYDDEDVDPENLPSGNKLARLVLGAIVAIVVFFIAFNLGKGSQDTISTPTSSISVSPTAPAPANPACVGLSVTYLDPHTGEDVITGGIPKDPAESKQFIADRATDPTVFQWYYNHSSLVDVLNQPKISDPWSLVTEPHKLGACWTKEGQKMYDNWKLVWMMTDAKPVPLPATGANAGVTSEGAATQSVGTIPAGTATEFTYRDANGRPVSNTLVRNECGNIVVPTPVPGVPSKPSVPRTTPPRTTTAPPTVPPTTTTPPPPTTETPTPPPPTTTTPPTTETTTPPPPPPTTAKTPTPNPSAPPGNVPLPTFGPSHTTPTPPPSNPAPPPSSGSEQAPYVPTPTSRVIPTPDAPVATVTTTAIPGVSEAPPPPPA